MKTIVLFLTLVTVIGAMFYSYFNEVAQERLNLELKELVEYSNMNFNNQKTTRKWNAQYNGVYVKPLPNQQPNKYLKNNTLKVDENLTLIKINPAWMTRQLSELNTLKDLEFRIVSLKPINPTNKPNAFEKKALEYIEKNRVDQYYELDRKSNRFKFMGALYTKKPCLECHQEQGYRLDDVRGGISINLDAAHYKKFEEFSDKQVLIRTLITTFLASIILAFIISITKKYKDVNKTNIKLKNSIDIKESDLNKITQLFQSLLDIQNNLLVVNDGEKLIYINSTALSFLEYESIEEFAKEHKCICEFFENVDNNSTYIISKMDHDTWIEFLQKNRHNNKLKVKMTKNGKIHIFKPELKIIDVDLIRYYLVIFDEITEHLKEKEELTTLAMLDTLTQLPNRRKIDIELEYKIEQSRKNGISLSIIFLDLDFFKQINDKYGHDVGDSVLIEVSQVLKNSIRQDDFLGRWGGEEFIIILKCDTKNINKIAQKIRSDIENYDFKHIHSLTMSAGVSTLKDDDTAESFIKRVDEALYIAKKSGRNQVVEK